MFTRMSPSLRSVSAPIISEGSGMLFGSDTGRAASVVNTGEN